VRPAAFVAEVLARRAVICPTPADAMAAASAQLRVERVEHLDVHRAGLESTHERADVLFQVRRAYIRRVVRLASRVSR